jgi:phospholipid/cholesterol/gamma-HCH transport system substrate-binding protein
MENRAYALAAGIFTLLLTAAIAATAVWFTGTTALQQNTYLLVSRSSVSGLNPEALVRFRGVTVGKVDTIGFDPINPPVILIRIIVDRTTPITKGTYAQLAYQGLTGLSYVQLEDDGRQHEPLKTDSDLPGKIEVRASVFDKLSESGQGLIVSANETFKRMNTLLNDKTQARLQQTLSNLEIASARIASVANELEPSLKTLPSLSAKTDQVLTRADAFFIHADKLATQAQEGINGLANVTQNAEKIAGTAKELGDTLLVDTLPRLSDLVADLSRTSRNLNGLLTEIRDQPQSLVFGRPLPPPGPGEEGFSPQKEGGHR